ncbi:hypothetical protein CC2G_008225 [Coprinopsis cinerea AmutBmut pab1-1]|nr:hypothetical protein CC2G_008225 [Coprinopsis cinerea AmutBmut pab1-1]
MDRRRIYDSIRLGRRYHLSIRPLTLQTTKSNKELGQYFIIKTLGRISCELTHVFYVFTDAGWAINIDRRSISGYVVVLAGGAVVWGARRSKTPSLRHPFKPPKNSQTYSRRVCLVTNTKTSDTKSV